MSVEQPEQLQPSLERARSALKTALAEACNTDVERLDTGELIRIEEVLAIANQAAKEAVSVRRRMRVGGRQSADADAPTSRRIVDAQGVEWSVFAVHPSSARGRPALGERFRDGWLSFDCGTETRRVAPIPESWQELGDDELVNLCARAEAARRRNPRPGSPQT